MQRLHTDRTKPISLYRPDSEHMGSALVNSSLCCLSQGYARYPKIQFLYKQRSTYRKVRASLCEKVPTYRRKKYMYRASVWSLTTHYQVFSVKSTSVSTTPPGMCTGMSFPGIRSPCLKSAIVRFVLTNSSSFSLNFNFIISSSGTLSISF